MTQSQAALCGIPHHRSRPRPARSALLALSLIYFGTSAGLYTLGIWSPLILQQFGFSPLQTGWINAVPSMAAVVAMIGWAELLRSHI